MEGYVLGSDTEWQEKFQTLVDTGRRMYGANVGYKDESWFMRLLGWLLFFCPTFMTEYSTTIGRTVWFPSRPYVMRDPRAAFEVLAHELTHMDRYGKSAWRFLWFSIRYLFPQCLGFLSLGMLSAIWVGWWGLLFGVFLFAFLPWPSPGRVREEVRGYAMSVVCRCWVYGRDWNGSAIPGVILDAFEGPEYYWMYRGDRESLRNRITLTCGWIVGDSTWELGTRVRFLCMYPAIHYRAIFGC